MLDQEMVVQVVLEAVVLILFIQVVLEELETLLLLVLLKEIMVVMEMDVNQDLLEEVAVEAVAQVLLEPLQLHHKLVMVEMV